MYIEASSPRKRGENAQLLTPTYSSPNGACLSFYYHMYGRTMGTLNVFMKQTGRQNRRLWTLSGNQGNTWSLVNIVVPASPSYAILFEGIVGNGYQSDIAIDDVSIKTGSCAQPGTFNL